MNKKQPVINEQLLVRIERLEQGQQEILSMLKQQRQVGGVAEVSKREEINLLFQQCNGDAAMAIKESNRRYDLEMKRVKNAN